jgi:hypothetical protein
MADVLLFNHIPKTAGSTLRYVLWRVLGRERVLTSTTLGRHRERIEAIGGEISDGSYAIVAHTGYGVQDHLPAQHSYSTLTILRDPVQRTISRYNMALSDGETEASLEGFLADTVLPSFNSQTAFLGGLWVKHNMQGEPLRRDQFDDALLRRAKRNLETHDVVGLTERFDQTLALLRATQGWPLRKTLYRPANVRPRAAAPTKGELAALRGSNELDIELYDFAQELFGARAVPARDLRRFDRLNSAYGAIYPVARRLRGRS